MQARHPEHRSGRGHPRLWRTLFEGTKTALGVATCQAGTLERMLSSIVLRSNELASDNEAGPRVLKIREILSMHLAALSSKISGRATWLSHLQSQI